MYTFGNVPLELRECVKKDGKPKRCFVSEKEAQQQIERAGWQRRYHAYKCSHDHWHVGRKYD